MDKYSCLSAFQCPRNHSPPRGVHTGLVQFLPEGMAVFTTPIQMHSNAFVHVFIHSVSIHFIYSFTFCCSAFNVHSIRIPFLSHSDVFQKRLHLNVHSRARTYRSAQDTLGTSHTLHTYEQHSRGRLHSETFAFTMCNPFSYIDSHTFTSAIAYCCVEAPDLRLTRKAQLRKAP